MPLLRGKLFAGALFVGLLYGAGQAIVAPAPTNIVYSGGGTISSYSNVNKHKEDRLDADRLARIAIRRADDDAMLHIIISAVTKGLI